MIETLAGDADIIPLSAGGEIEGQGLRLPGAQGDGLRGLAMYTARMMDLARAHPDAPTRDVTQKMCDLLIPIVKAHITNRAFEVCSTAIAPAAASI